MRARVLLVYVSVGVASVAFGGDTNPPAGPVAGTMLTLEEMVSSTPITSVPMTIGQGGAYHLASDLSVPAGMDGITIDVGATGFVDLDLRGHSISGPPTAGAIISIPGTNLADITLKRGYIGGGTNNVDVGAVGTAPGRTHFDGVILFTGLEFADAASNAIDLKRETVVIVDQVAILGAGGHGLHFSAAAGARADLHNVVIEGVAGDGISDQSPTPQTREHILLARQVSISNSGGAGINAPSRVGFDFEDVIVDGTGGAGMILGDNAILRRVRIENSAGIGLDVGAYAQVVSSFVHPGDFTTALTSIIAEPDLVSRDSHFFGPMDLGNYAKLRNVTNVVNIDHSGFSPTILRDGDHVVRESTFIIHGTSTANLPAIEFRGDDGTVRESHFLIADPPAGARGASRMPPHFKCWWGNHWSIVDNTTQGIHPGTEGMLLTGTGHEVVGNSFIGTGGSAIGILISGASNCLITGNRFSSMGSGAPISEPPPSMNVIGPIVTPATLSANCNPDRNLHVPN